MATATLTIDSRALEERLKSLSDKQVAKIVTTALREGAKVYQAAVVESAPIRTDDVTRSTSDALPPGALKHDVVLRKEGKALAYDVRFGAETAHVARFVDEGHRIVIGGRSSLSKKTGKTRGKGRQVGFVTGSGFFRRAFDESTQKASEVVEATIKTQIEKEWKK